MKDGAMLEMPEISDDVGVGAGVADVRSRLSDDVHVREARRSSAVPYLAVAAAGRGRRGAAICVATRMVTVSAPCSLQDAPIPAHRRGDS